MIRPICQRSQSRSPSFEFPSHSSHRDRVMLRLMSTLLLSPKVPGKPISPPGPAMGSLPTSRRGKLCVHSENWICVLFKANTRTRAWKVTGNRLLNPCYLSRDEHNRKIRTRKPTTDVGKYSFINRIIQSWKQLPASLLASSPLN